MNGFARQPARRLRLMAETSADVPAIAALVQDAVLRAGDLVYDSSGRHFTIRMNRFCHETAAARSGAALRAPSALRIESIIRVQVRGFDPRTPGQVLSLLDLGVEELDAPAVALTLRFAGDGVRDIRIEAECLDLRLLDLGAPRRVRLAPNHATE